MEDTKSAALTEDGKNYLRNADGDIFEIIKTAIMVAASDHPTEFQNRRHKIAQTLLSDESIKRGKKQRIKVSHETEEESKIVSEPFDASVLIQEEGLEWNNSHGKPPMEKQILPTCKQQRPTMVITLKLNKEPKYKITKGPVTPENKVKDHGARVYNQGVAEVLRMKRILDKSGDASESEAVVCDVLAKLESMGLSMKTLEATVIGKSVTALKKHPSEKVRKIAVTLVKAWKRTVDEWIKKQSNDVEPTTQQLMQTNPNMNTERKLEGSEQAAKIENGELVESLEKLEEKKEKLQEEYEKAKNMKNQRVKAWPTMMPIKLNTETKFQIQKWRVTPEKKVDDHGARVYDKEVAEVFRIKKILDDGSESESVVCDLLTKLLCMGLSYKTLKATMIGKTVSTFKKHASEKVREIAVTLVKAWKRTADEWIEKQSSHVPIEPALQQLKQTNLNMNTEKKLAGSEKAAKIRNGGVMDSLEKLEATKRKLQEGYEKAENMKKTRRIQVLELHEVKKQGLLPPQEIPRINNRRKVYGRC